MEMNKFNFKKKYGQNFLQDVNIINKIINEISVLENDLIIEVAKKCLTYLQQPTEH